MELNMMLHEIVIAWSDALNKLDVGTAKGYMSDDFKLFEDSTNFEPIGLDRWAKGVASFFVAFPDWRWERKSLHTKENLAVCEFEESGTFTKSLMMSIDLKIQPTGASYVDRSGLWITVNNNHQISEIRAYSTQNMERVFQFKEQLNQYRAANGVGW
jgi:hypothetical protein